MKTKITLPLLSLALGLTLSLPTGTALAQGTAFTYQGMLNDGTNPANGSYDLRLTVYNALTGGAQKGNAVTNTAAAVNNGRFTVTLDPGAGVFDGSARWLEIAVRTNSGGAFTTLTPRQTITPAPYAIHAGQVNATDVVGTLPPSALLGGYPGSVQFTDPGNQFHGSFQGDGSGLTGVDAMTFNGLPADRFWQTGGNVGIVAGMDYLGTADPNPLELRVNNERALLVKPSVPPGGTPNWIGGHSANSASGSGNVIGGGGENVFPNQATGDYGVIGGGIGNTVGTNSVVGGGVGNFASGQQAAIGGGEAGIAQGNHSTVGGGKFNDVTGEFGTIAGGSYNQAHGYAAVVGGGGGADPTSGDIYGNQARGNWSVVGGGRLNLATNTFATASGGGYNHVSGYAATIAGGGGLDPNLGTLLTNRASGSWSVISGGRENSADGESATVGGGERNTALGKWATASGGTGNQSLGGSATVGGGFYNAADSSASTVSGGAENAALRQYTTVGGGVGNYAHGEAATIGGGANNLSDGPYATVPGGREAKPSQYGQLAHAAGMFINPGDAQHSIFILRGLTDPATPTTQLALDGGGTMLAIQPNQTLAFDILLVARANPNVPPGTDSLGFHITGVVKDMNGTATFVGSPTYTTLGTDPVAWSVQLLLAGNKLTIDASGNTSSSGSLTTVRWVARVDAADVSW